MRNLDLERTLYAYIKANETENLDIIDINTAFPKYGIERIMQSLNDLRTVKLLYRVSIGSYYKYTTIKPEIYENT